jgi:hypothetical protein
VTKFEVRLSASINIVRFRSIGIIAGVLAAVDLYDMGVGMFATLNFRHNVSARNILPSTNVVVLIPSSRTIILTSDFSHAISPSY